MANNILAAAEKWGEALGQKIRNCISQIALTNTDLVVVNAEYNEQCYTSFCKPNICKHYSSHVRENSYEPELNHNDEEEDADEVDLLDELVAQEERQLDDVDAKPQLKRS